uniref:Uncharacterized protein n=1 Tax=Lepeophtheirus salmonis TaxID=72036 RepID=A0A0K2TW42_LEPSM
MKCAWSIQSISRNIYIADSNDPQRPSISMCDLHGLFLHCFYLLKNTFIATHMTCCT